MAQKKFHAYIGLTALLNILLADFLLLLLSFFMNFDVEADQIHELAFIVSLTFVHW